MSETKNSVIKHKIQINNSKLSLFQNIFCFYFILYFILLFKYSRLCFHLTFASHPTHNQELTQLHCRKTNNPIKKWAKKLIRHVFKDIERAQRLMKGCSASLAIREMQIETTLRYHLTPVRMAIINKSTNNK